MFLTLTPHHSAIQSDSAVKRAKAGLMMLRESGGELEKGGEAEKRTHKTASTHQNNE